MEEKNMPLPLDETNAETQTELCDGKGEGTDE